MQMLQSWSGDQTTTSIGEMDRSRAIVARIGTGTGKEAHLANTRPLQLPPSGPGIDGWMEIGDWRFLEIRGPNC